MSNLSTIAIQITICLAISCSTCRGIQTADLLSAPQQESLDETFREMESLMQFYEKGDVDSTFRLAKNVFETRNRILGKDHPLTWTSFLVYEDACDDSGNELPKNLNSFAFIESKASKNSEQVEKLEAQLQKLASMYSVSHPDYLLLLIFQSRIASYQRNASPVKDETAEVRRKFKERNDHWRSQKLAEIEAAFDVVGDNSYLSYQTSFVASQLADTDKKSEAYLFRMLESAHSKTINKNWSSKETAIRLLVILLVEQERLDEALSLIQRMKSKATSKRFVRDEYARALIRARKFAEAKNILIEHLEDDLHALKQKTYHYYTNFAILNLLLESGDVVQFDQVVSRIEGEYEKTFGIESRQSMQCQINMIRILRTGIKSANEAGNSELAALLSDRLAYRELLQHKALMRMENDLLRSHSFIVLCRGDVQLNNTASIFRLMDNYRKRVEKEHGSDSSQYRQVQQSAAIGLLEVGVYGNTASEICITAALELNKAYGGLSTEQIIKAKEMFGLRFAELGRFKDAKPYLDAAVESYMARDDMRPKHLVSGPIAAQIALARSNTALEKYEDALENCRDLLKRYKDLPDLKTRNQCVAVAKGQMGRTYYEAGNMDAAAQFLESAIKTMDDYGSGRVGNRERLLLTLAELFERTGKTEDAITIYQQCIDETKTWRGRNTNTLAALGVEGRVASLMIGRRETDQVLSMFRKSLKSLKEVASEQAGLMSRENQLKLLDHLDLGNQLNDAIRYAVSVRDQHNSPQQSFEWIANVKSFATKMWGKQLSSMKHNEHSDALQELVRIRGEIATLAINTDAKSLPQVPLRFLLEQETASFSRSAAKSARYESDAWIDTAAIRKSLAPNSIYLDFYRTTLEIDNASVYAVWVAFPHKESVELVILPNADEIDSLVNTIRREISTQIQQPVVSDNDVVDGFLNELSTMLFQPLQKYLHGVEQIVLCPDEQLWLLPWSALKSPGSNKYLIENFKIRFISCGADLALPNKSATELQAVVFANPDFNQRLSNRSILERINVNKDSPIKVKRRLPNAQSLPLTEAEARAIAPSLERFIGVESVLLLREDATEEAAKAVNRPKAVVFSTHGFFLENKTNKMEVEQRSLAEEPQLQTGSIVFDNPLLRCGLLMSGSNSVVSPGYNDGVLTGLEVAGMDLEGTELVVLSACDTGVGDIQNGEGVAGLRQAFQLAGAKSVLASLWQVDDAETARLMKEFFNNLANGMTKSEALRQAQISRIKARRARHGAAHPFFWAAFTLTGQD